jgi:hypothetical protein
MPAELAPRACAADADCLAGEACFDGSCQPAMGGGECDADHACPPNAVCQDGRCLILR